MDMQVEVMAAFAAVGLLDICIAALLQATSTTDAICAHTLTFHRVKLHTDGGICRLSKDPPPSQNPHPGHPPKGLPTLRRLFLPC